MKVLWSSYPFQLLLKFLTSSLRLPFHALVTKLGLVDIFDPPACVGVTIEEE
jgi:hypothetical protein